MFEEEQQLSGDEFGKPEDDQLPDDNSNGDAEQQDKEIREPPELPEATVDDEEIDDVPLKREEIDNFVADFCSENEDLYVLLTGSDESSVKNETYPEWDMTEEDSYIQMNLVASACPGLVGNTNCDFFNAYSLQPQYYGNSSCLNKSYDGHQGQEKFGKMDLAKMFLGVGKTVNSHLRQNKVDGDAGSSKGLLGKIFKGILGRHKCNASCPSIVGGSTGSGFGGTSNIFHGLAEGKGIGTVIGGLIAGSGGFGYRGTSGQYAGGGNISPSSLSGGLIDKIGVFVSDKLHKYFGVDPATGRIIGAVAGNVIFRLAGKDNKLGNIGKVILDNIVTGKYKRNVDPYVPSGSDWEAQDFHALRNDCLKNRRLFEDPYFLANDQSLFYSQKPPESVQWLRPAEISNSPQLFVEGHSRFDVVQGVLNDCWLLAAMANLTLRDELFYRVVPPDQSFAENYAGIFHFQFWRYGKWVDVVVDDRLPCHNGNLLYLHSSHNNEFWSALLEKALYGSYEALIGGNTSEALCDFTGGITEFIDLKDQPANLMQMMFKSFECGSLMGCSLEADPQSFEAKLPNGLVLGHAYSITGMKIMPFDFSVECSMGSVPLLRIRNPWGNQQEWNGAWSDNSSEWNSLSEIERQNMSLQFAHDGEFWMNYEDFCANFEKLEICHLGPDVVDDIEQMTGTRPKHEEWQMQCIHGEWISGQTAGGCRNFLKTFATNPQYFVSLPDAEPGDKDGLSVAIMSVLQKDRREKRKDGVDLLPIGFSVYEDKNSGGPLSEEFIARQKSCARIPLYLNLREISGRFRLHPSNYVVIPSTFEPNQEAAYMLRIFSYSSVTVSQLQ